MDWVKFIFCVLLSSLYLYSAIMGERWNMGSGLKWGERKGPKKLMDKTLKYRDCKYLELIDGKLYCNLFNDWLPDFNYCGADATYDCEMQKDLNDYMEAQDSQNNQGV